MRIAAFQEIHVFPEKHSDERLLRKCDYQTDGQTDPRHSDPYVPLCLTGNTKKYNPLEVDQRSRDSVVSYMQDMDAIPIIFQVQVFVNISN